MKVEVGEARGRHAGAIAVALGVEVSNRIGRQRTLRLVQKGERYTASTAEVRVGHAGNRVRPLVQEEKGLALLVPVSRING